MKFKTGKKHVRRLMSTPALGDFLPRATEWPDVPPSGLEYTVPIGALEMLGNDKWGICAEAGAMHFIQDETAAAGSPLHGTLQQTIDLYTALTGFDPKAPVDANGENPTDQGTDLLSLLQHWKKHGIEVTDTGGKTVLHTILGFASLDIGSIAQLRYACRTFGGLYHGIQLIQSAMNDTSDWQWNPKSPRIGGHCINQPGQGSLGGHIQSWGMNIPTSWAFMLNSLDESYVIVSPYWLNRQGKAPSGLDLDGLLAAFKKF